MLITISNMKPQIMLTIIAVLKGNIITGIMKDDAITNLNRNVDRVDSQICLLECIFSDSSETWIPKASEKESAIAIARMPPRTTSFEFVPEFKPTIRPSVVIMPDVNPKLNPTSIECLMALQGNIF